MQDASTAEVLKGSLERVAKLCRRARKKTSDKVVHDLRVALRTCRNSADVLSRVDPHGDWQRMRRTGRKLFRALGSLRDMQVLEGWVRALGETDDPVREALERLLRGREKQALRGARGALRAFDLDTWKTWTRSLPVRAARIEAGGAPFQHVALERLEEARELHERAEASGLREDWHAARIGIKHFRYTVDGFLPQHREDWIPPLKRMQDLLGEGHDFDVLLEVLEEIRERVDPSRYRAWQSRIRRESDRRLEEYLAIAGGKHAVFERFAEGLPRGSAVDAALRGRLLAWVGGFGRETERACRLERVALHLFDGLTDLGGCFLDAHARNMLSAAALLCEAGRDAADERYHLESARRIRTMKPPLGWTRGDVEVAALIARYHAGARPSQAHPAWVAQPTPMQQLVGALAGVLRLAHALADLVGVDGFQPGVDRDSITLLLPSPVRGEKAQRRLESAKRLLEQKTGRLVILETGKRKLRRLKGS